jgi:hypothetical protein
MRHVAQVWRCGTTLDIDKATQGKALLCRYLCNEPQSRYGYLERHAPDRKVRLLERHQDMALCTSFHDDFIFQLHYNKSAIALDSM